MSPDPGPEASPGPPADLFSKLADALKAAIQGIRSAILLYGVAVAVLLVGLLGLRPELARDPLRFLWVVVIAPALWLPTLRSPPSRLLAPESWSSGFWLAGFRGSGGSAPSRRQRWRSRSACLRTGERV